MPALTGKAGSPEIRGAQGEPESAMPHWKAQYGQWVGVTSPPAAGGAAERGALSSWVEWRMALLFDLNKERPLPRAKWAGTLNGLPARRRSLRVGEAATARNSGRRPPRSRPLAHAAREREA